MTVNAVCSEKSVAPPNDRGMTQVDLTPTEVIPVNTLVRFNSEPESSSSDLTLAATTNSVS
jgi:hypothetical protein